MVQHFNKLLKSVKKTIAGHFRPYLGPLLNSKQLNKNKKQLLRQLGRYIEVIHGKCSNKLV